MRLLLLLVSIGTVHAATTLKGQLVRNREGGPPISGASVSAVGANPTTSTNSGSFTLEFPKGNPGNEVQLQVSMPSLVVVNWVGLRAVLPAQPDDHVVILLLAREADREEMAAEYFRIRSTRAIERAYEQRLKAAGQDQARLLEQLKQAKDLAARTAQELAKVQPGQESPLYEGAMRLVAEGKVDEALRALDGARLEARAQEAREKKVAADRQLHEAARAWSLRGSLLATRFEFAEAERAHRKAVETDPEDFGARSEFAYFLARLNRNPGAREQYERCLEIAKSAGDNGRVAGTLNNLGMLNHTEHRMAEARKAYEDALATLAKLPDARSENNLASIALIYNNLGALHRDQNRPEEALKAYGEALRIRRRLAGSNPDAYRPDVAVTLNSLGILHRIENRLEEAENALEEALAIRRNLAASDRNSYLPDVAGVLVNLGNLYGDQRRMEEARKAYDEALTAYRELAASNPEAYRPYVAGTLFDVGNLCLSDYQIDRARKAFEESLGVYRELAASNGRTYRPYVAQVLWGVGRIHMADRDFVRAQSELKEALAIYSEFAKDDAAQFDPLVQAVKVDLERSAP